MSSTYRPPIRSRKVRLAAAAVTVLAAALFPWGAPPASAQAGGADLSISMSHSPSAPVTGDEVTLTLVASNSGPATATDVVVGISLGYPWSYVSSSGDDCGIGGENNSLLCAVGPVAPGASATLTVTARALASGVFVMPAAVASETPDPDTADRAVTETLLVRRGPARSERAVGEIYRLVLGRAPSVRELAYWAERWDATQWDDQHRVPMAIITSPESTGRRVRAAYTALLGRGASPADVGHWSGELARGLSFEDFEASVMASAEFSRRNGPGQADVVTAIYEHVVGRPATGAEVSSWSTRTATGASLGQLTSELQRSNEARSRVISHRIQEVLERAAGPFDRWVWVSALNDGSTHDEQWARLFTNGEFLERFPWDYEYQPGVID